MRLVDLFSGCGGFSLGAHQAGFDVAAAFDNDPILSSSFPFNFPEAKLIHADVTQLTGLNVEHHAGGTIDGIFGGPPCQGFSDIGKRDVNDPRRQLLWHFFRIVDEVRPTFFVMENVRGLAYADARGTLDEALDIVRDQYFILGPSILDARDFGAATKRRRLFVIGIHKGRADPLEFDDLAIVKQSAAIIRDAIHDLQGARWVSDIDGFDVWKIARKGRPSEYASRLRSKNGLLTGHRITKHTDKVMERFSKIAPGAVDSVGRHPRLAWDGQCPALRAGTGSELGSYQSVRPIHPEEDRVITVREAARLQGFPDAYRFHQTVWHSFRMIGNSVSPIISRAIFLAIRRKLEACISLT